MKFFKDIDFNKLLHYGYPAPFVPELKGLFDYKYIDPSVYDEIAHDSLSPNSPNSPNSKCDLGNLKEFNYKEHSFYCDKEIKENVEIDIALSDNENNNNNGIIEIDRKCIGYKGF